MIIGPISSLLRALAAMAMLAVAAQLLGGEVEVRAYDIPAGLAADTLKLAASQGQIELVYTSSTIAGVTTRPVYGLCSAQVALDRLLHGTPLVAILANNGRAFGIVNRSSASEFGQQNPKNQHLSLPSKTSTDMSSKTDTHTSRTKSIVTGFLAVLLSGSPTTAPAQTVMEEDDSIYKLNPFQVSAEQDQGYVASQTLSGTRLNTKLKDIASTVTVLTKDLLLDTGSSTIQDFLIYTPNAEISGPSGNFANPTPGLDTAGGVRDSAFGRPESRTRIRGLAAADLARNYFPTSIAMDTYNTTHVDINRGANSILFGLGSPAGIVNSTTIAPMFNNRGEAQFIFGSYGTIRGSLDVERVLVDKKLSLRVALLDSKRKYQQKPAHVDDTRGFAVAEFRPFKSTMVRVSGETGRIRGNRPRNLPPGDSLTQWFDVAPNGVRKPTHDPSKISGPNLYDSQGVSYGDAYWGPGAYTWNPVLVYAPGASATDLSYADGAPDGHEGFINTAHGVNLLTGIRFAAFVTLRGTNQTYLGSTAVDQNGNSVAATASFYPNKVITDESIFDFRNLLLDGPNKYENLDFDVINGSVSQTFLENQLGFEYSFNREKTKERTGGLLGNGSRWYALQIDPNIRYANGATNPYFGNVFVSASGNTYSESSSLLQNHRLTGFAIFDASKKINGWLGKLLGSHTFTGLLETQKTETESRGYQQNAWGDDFGAFIGARGNSALSTDRQLGAIFYLGGNLANANSAAGANLTNISGTIEFKPQYTIRAFNRLTGLLEDRSFSVEEGLGVRGNLNKNQVDTKALILNSRFLDGNVIGVFGIRKDEFDVWSNANPPTGTGARRILSSDRFFLPDTATYSENVSNNTFGVVVHVPSRIADKLPIGMGLSFHASKSDNTRVGQSRIDLNGNTLKPVTGSTEEKGFTVSFLNERLVLRANWYETLETGADAGLTSNFVSMVGSEATLLASIPDLVQYNPFNTPNIQKLLQYPALPASVMSLLNVVINPQNGTSTLSPPTGLSVTTDRTSKGIEFELMGRVTRNWNVMFNASKQSVVSVNTGALYMEYVKERMPIWEEFSSFPRSGTDSTSLLEAIQIQSLTSAQKLILQDGSPRSDEVRKWRLNLVSNYIFPRDSRFKGVNVGGAVRWQDKVAVGFPLINDPELGYLPDVNHPIYGPAETNVDAWIGYALPKRFLRNKVSCKVQLNVRNVFDKDDLIPVAAAPDGTFPVVRIPAERTMEVRTTFQF